ncbi:MAG: YggS family pyridoxal phosphate-dependent enzyme [Mariprofundaceae bacterium]
MEGDKPAGLLDRWRSLKRELAADDVAFLAVSKYASDADVALLIEAGQQDFGESRPQQLRDRAQRYPSVRWHMIGALQHNKAKYIARHAAMWHSVEDVRTAQAVAGYVVDRRLPVWLQVNISGLAHQHGVPPDALAELLKEVQEISQLQVIGLMAMASRGSHDGDDFSSLRGLRDALMNGSLCTQERCPNGLKLCMGMSGDYRAALAMGTDMVRIGSGLFDSISQG